MYGQFAKINIKEERALFGLGHFNFLQLKISSFSAA